MKIIKVLVLLCVLFGLLVSSLPVYAQSTVDGDVGTTFIWFSFDSKSFDAHDRIWIFYQQEDGADDGIYWRSSTDFGATWSIERYFEDTESITAGFDLWYDGTYGHIAFDPPAGNLNYARFSPNADGTITRGVNQTIDAAVNPTTVTIAVDTSGYAWVGYNDGNEVYAKKNANNDGTWSTERTDLISAGIEVSVYIKLLPLTSERMAAVYFDQQPAPDVWRVRRWTGAGWGTSVANIGGVNATIRADCVVQDDNVHLIYQDNGQDVTYERWQYSTNSFGSVQVIYDGSANEPCAIQINTSTNDLFVFYGKNDDHLYYTKYDALSASWETEIDWINESVIDGIQTDWGYMVQEYGGSRMVGLYYIAGAAGAPFILKYKEVAEAGNVTTLTPSPVTESSASLRGDITSIGTGTITVRGFQYNTSPSATGAGITQETGAFGTGVYSLTVTDLWADDLFYVRAYVTNNVGTIYGEWVQFLTAQGEQSSPWNPVGNDTLVPVPSEPGGWFNPSPDPGNVSSTWLGSILNPFLEASGFPIEFLWWVIFILLLEIVGIMAYGVGKHTIVIFIFGSVILGYICAASLIDWWLIFVYIMVGIPFLILESRRY